MRSILYLAIVVSLITGCSKESSETFVPYNGHPLNDTVWAASVPPDAAAYRMAAELSPAPLVDSFNASSTSVVHFSNGVEVTIPSGSCVFANGTAVTGQVVLSVNYLKLKGDNVRFLRPTSSFTSVLESAGSFFISATQNGQEVFLKPGKRAIISFIEPNTQTSMNVFYGLLNPPQPLPVGMQPGFTWVPATDSSRVSTFTRIDVSGVVTGYNIFSGRFGWINCQRFIDSTLPKTRITALLPANYTNTNTNLFAVFKNTGTVVQLYADYPNRLFYAHNIPLGTELKIVAVSLRGTEYYLGTKDIVVTDNMIISLAPDQKSKGDVGSLLDNL